MTLYAKWKAVSDDDDDHNHKDADDTPEDNNNDDSGDDSEADLPQIAVVEQDSKGNLITSGVKLSDLSSADYTKNIIKAQTGVFVFR
jgi:hypothetical protein